MSSHDKITLSVIKADIGGFVGHSSIHPQIMDYARERVKGAVDDGLLVDGYVTRCGDDLQLIMTHRKGLDHPQIHEFAWAVFKEGTDIARKLKQYGAGQDLLKDAFAGTVKGMGPGVAAMEFVERPSEPVVVFMADKTSPGAWNLPLCQIYANPFNTAGLIIDTKLHEGCTFEVMDLIENKTIILHCPEEYYDLLMFAGAPGRFMIKNVFRRFDGEIAASASTQKLSRIAGKYVGKDDPVLITRTQSGFPALGETLEPFTFPHLVEGWMRGSHRGPLMPVAFNQANPSRFDGPPRVIAAGFQLAEGKLIGPRDLFDDPAFDAARDKANQIADFLRAHGPFEPHRLGLDEMEYTTMPGLMKKLEDRWQPISEAARSSPTAAQ